MKNIIEIDGNALSFAKWTHVAHCANCCNTFGSGIAYAIRNKFPAAFGADTHADEMELNKLGNISYAEVAPSKWIINLYGQQNPGSQRQINYEGLYTALEKARILCDDNDETAGIAFPYKMGSDRAGGDWRIVSSMIEVVFESATYPIYIVKLQ